MPTPPAASVSRSGDSLDDFAGRACGPVAGAIAAGARCDRGRRRRSRLDILNRSIGRRSGPGRQAAAEVAYLTDAANRLGLEVQSV